MNGTPEARTPGASPGNADGSTEDRAIVAPAADDGKAVATWAATLALLGLGLYRLASGGFLVTRAGLTRELPDLRAVATLARQIGAAKAPQ